MQNLLYQELSREYIDLKKRIFLIQKYLAKLILAIKIQQFYKYCTCEITYIKIQTIKDKLAKPYMKNLFLNSK